MNLRELLSTIWQRRLIVALVLVFCLVGAGLYASSQPKKNYASSATIAFLPDPENHQTTPSENLSSLLTTYAVVAQSQKTIDAATQILGHPLTGSVSASTSSDSWILAITSEASAPRAAAETARAVTRALSKTIRNNGVLVPSVINSPVAASAPIESRSPAVIIAVAAVIGLIGGVLLALLIENLGGLPEGRPPETAPGQEHSA